MRKTRLDGRPKLIPNPDFADRGWRAYVWNNVPGCGAEDLAYRLANGGYKVVLCPVSNLYFDLAWNQNPEEPGLDWGGYVDLQEAVRVHPLRLLPQRPPRPAGQPRRPRRLRREGPPDRLRPLERPRHPGQPVVRDPERRRTPRLQARAEAPRPRRAGLGPGPGLGPGDATRRSPRRSSARPGPSSSTSSGSASCRASTGRSRPAATGSPRRA